MRLAATQRTRRGKPPRRPPQSRSLPRTQSRPVPLRTTPRSLLPTGRAPLLAPRPSPAGGPRDQTLRRSCPPPRRRSACPGREYPEGQAAYSEDQSAHHVEEPPGVRPSVLALLAATVSVLEALPGLALFELLPALFRSRDHALRIVPATRPA